MNKKIQPEKHIVVFDDQKIRREFYENAWWFVITDIVSALTDTVDASQYIKKMRNRDEELSKAWGQLVTALLIGTEGGVQKLNCANTEGVFRIIQSIPSQKAEPFKRWLAKVGYERIQEIEDPELASHRAREIYKAKGYDDAWIEKRMRGIQVRENLRDHMTDLELIFSMLGEASTTEITRNKDAQGFKQNKSAALAGGKIAGNARKNLEKQTRKKVSTSQNYLDQAKKQITESE